MKQNHCSILLAALALGALGGCNYYETPTTEATPHYGPGHVVTTLPEGYQTVTIGGTRYYSYGDAYYRPHGSGYIVVDSPRHPSASVTVMRTLPSGYRVVTRHGQRYYQVGDVYYQDRYGGYVVVESPF